MITLNIGRKYLKILVKYLLSKLMCILEIYISLSTNMMWVWLLELACSEWNASYIKANMSLRQKFSKISEISNTFQVKFPPVCKFAHYV